MIHVCIIALEGMSLSRRVLHGVKNAFAYFQSTIPPLLNRIGQATKAWIHDFIIHAKTEHDFFTYLEKLFNICEKLNLVVWTKRIELYKQEVRWCG